LEIPWEPLPRTSNPELWYPQHDAYVARAQKSGIEVLFIGDSITKEWVRDPNKGYTVWKRDFMPLGAENFGISGDSTQNVLWRLINGELQNINPKALVLLIGTNNLAAGNTPADTANGILAIINAVRARLFFTKIILIGVLPRNLSTIAASDAMRIKINQLNQIISGYGNTPGVTYIDIGPQMLLPDGTVATDYTYDGTHLTTAGYEIMAAALKPRLQTILDNAQISTVLVNSQLTITFPRIRSDLIYQVEVSSDLLSWSPIATNPGEVGQPVTVSDTVELDSAVFPRRFMRPRVTNP
jgi:lysophospholipase L1-like esterase